MEVPREFGIISRLFTSAKEENQMKALHFGAGNIGKGLIAYSLNKTGYEVCFVDVNQDSIDRLNRDKGYVFELLDENHTPKKVSPVSALNSITQEAQVLNAIINADLITTSVGITNIPRIAGIIAKGLQSRMEITNRKIDIIANENAINASSILKAEVKNHVSLSDFTKICTFVGFPNSAIDRLALSKNSDEGEIVLVEPFYEWIINESEIINHDLPKIKNAIYVKNLQPYIERKLYIVNMGHATTAYIAFLAGEPTIQSALKNPVIESFVRGTLKEVSYFIIEKTNFNSTSMNEFIEKTLDRFKNEQISDEITRVGRSPIRKLGVNERLVTPIRELFELGLSFEHLTLVIASAFLFDNPDDEESFFLKNYIDNNGIESAILKFTQIHNEEISIKIKQYYCQFRNLHYNEVIEQLEQIETGNSYAK